MDPARIADIRDIAEARGFSARDTEKFALAIAGGGSEHADVPLWDMLHILFALGALLQAPRLAPRDAAVSALMDETGLGLKTLRAAGAHAVLAGASVAASAEGISLAQPQAPARTFAWSRVRRALGLADFLFAADSPGGGSACGLTALRNALDTLFDGPTLDESVLKRAVQEPARFFRAWRKAHLPLLAFADLIRLREAFLAGSGRRGAQRGLDPDDLVALWAFALERGQTWSFARFVEKASALLREERAGAGRRDFLAPLSTDDVIGGVGEGSPEDALVAWLDLSRDAGVALDETGPDDAEPDDGDGPLEPTLSALLRLPAEPKLLTKEEREATARLLALLPLAHEQPLSLLRARAVAPWENRLVEASRRFASSRAAVATEAARFDYAALADETAKLLRRLEELLLIGAALGAARDPADPRAVAEGEKILKRWRHDRTSFRAEDAKLRLIFARAEGDIRSVGGALARISRAQARFAGAVDLVRQAAADERLFEQVFARRYDTVLETR